MTKDTNKEGSISKKIITIRSIDTEIYKKFAEKIKTLNINMGEAMTKMMIGVLENTNQELGESASISLREDMQSISVTEQSKLVISKKDLLELENSFFFTNIQYLKFDSDIDSETFMKKVIAIRACQRVIIPNFLPRLKLLSKIKYCQNVEFYDVAEDDNL